MSNKKLGIPWELIEEDLQKAYVCHAKVMAACLVESRFEFLNGCSSCGACWKEVVWCIALVRVTIILLECDPGSGILVPLIELFGANSKTLQVGARQGKLL